MGGEDKVGLAIADFGRVGELIGDVEHGRSVVCGKRYAPNPGHTGVVALHIHDLAGLFQDLLAGRIVDSRRESHEQRGGWNHHAAKTVSKNGRYERGAALCG